MRVCIKSGYEDMEKGMKKSVSKFLKTVNYELQEYIVNSKLFSLEENNKYGKYEKKTNRILTENYEKFKAENSNNGFEYRELTKAVTGENHTNLTKCNCECESATKYDSQGTRSSFRISSQSEGDIDLKRRADYDSKTDESAKLLTESNYDIDHESDIGCEIKTESDIYREGRTEYNTKEDESTNLLTESNYDIDRESDIDCEIKTEYDSKRIESTNMLTKRENSASDCEDADKKGFSLRGLSRRKKLVLISICVSNCFNYLSFSLMAPFFPKEALSKHVNNTVSGWIFGIFAGTQTICCPIFGKLQQYTGLRLNYSGGILLSGLCTMLFGLTTYINTSYGPWLFILACLLLRILSAVSFSAIEIASFVLLAVEFPDHLSTVCGLTEVFFGIGCMVGPAVGGFLYAAGGFVVPFAVIGGLLISLAPVTLYLIPRNTTIRLKDKSRDGSKSLWTLFLSVKCILICLTIIVCATTQSMLDPTLEPHLRQFNLSPELLGLVFLMWALIYCISSPAWGYIVEKVPDNRVVIILGLVLTAASLLLLGPSTLVGFAKNDNYLWLNIVALAVLGCFYTAILIPTYESIFLIAKNLGLKDDINTYGMIAGAWGSMYALGDFIGPFAGGWLFEEIGFQWQTTIVAGVCLLMALLLALNWMSEVAMATYRKYQGYSQVTMMDKTMQKM